MKSIGKYQDVSCERVVQYPNGRVLCFFAYDSYRGVGFFGGDFNGVAIRDEASGQVLADNIGMTNSFGERKAPYFGMSSREIVEALARSTWNGVCSVVNSAARCAVPLAKEHPLNPRLAGAAGVQTASVRRRVVSF